MIAEYILKTSGMRIEVLETFKKHIPVLMACT